MATNYEDLARNRAVTAQNNGKSFMKELERMKPQLAAALPKHLNADRMSRIALTEFRKNPKLAECDTRSVLGAIVTLAQLGLEPGIMGQGFLVPYSGQCQPIPGWQGIVDLVSRTGRATVWTGAVYYGDEFDYALGDRPFIVHRPGDHHGEDVDTITHFYAVGRVNGAEWPVIEVWTARRVENHRNKHNKVGKRHYSYGNWEMYGRKVPLLQVCKYMPKSVELQQAMDLEGAANEGQPIGNVFDGEFTIVDAAAEPEEPKAPQPPPRRAEQEPVKKPEPDQPEPETPNEPEQPADEGDDGAPPQLNYSQACTGIAKARTVDELDMIRSQITDLNDRHQKSLHDMIANKAKVIESGGNSELSLD